MYRVLSGRELADNLSTLREMDTEFIYEEKGKYFLLTDKKDISAYAFILETSEGYILKRILVKKEKRYQSLGTKLLDHVINYALKHGVDSLIIEDIIEESYFEKKGFSIVKNKMIYHGIQKKNERLKDSVKGTWISIFVNVLLSVFKIIVGIFGKSRALVADGFHSISDVVGSIVILLSVYFGNIPEDEDHPYGHEKIESIAGNIVGVLLVITAFELVRDSVLSLIKGVDFVKPLKITIYVALFSVVVKYYMYLYKKRIGLRTKSDAVLADAREHRSDAVSSMGVVIGLMLSIYVNPVFDTLMSILVSLFIGKEGIHIIMETSNNILDKQDKEFLDKIEEYVYNNTEIKNIHDILMRVSGHKIFLSFHIRVPKDMTVYEAHTLADDLKYSLLSDFDELRDVIIHIDYIID
ncbi:cation diffusion facilitator family transporter [Ilyobacter polytropus]|uniref:Cation diffusion facilitator family transporter n=1 Tax=Ilyobacter polytropus (strain ATCC 51220 / DSM 2926 / LMG 16218 / CuHBu1) TaxID=572544 RepID=E3H7U6_ILYPC|nr:cation diffusion facilitator family transporter [Ilyobacter polytropus]ADO82898.1 cation diffusion facilitator family transporter [Ilyobacter polytropus DSM 2926]